MRRLAVNRIRSARLVLAFFLCPWLVACSTSAGDFYQVVSARGLNARVDATVLNPHWDYLRVTVNGRPTLMVLGFRDPAGEVWYSGGGREVLRLRDGLIVGSANLPQNWLDVRYTPAPNWHAGAQTLQRRVDLRPGYRFGVLTTLQLQPSAVVHASALRGVDPDSLRWYAVHDGPRVDHYGVDSGGNVVYGEQCLAADLCLTWQRWGTAQQAAARG